MADKPIDLYHKHTKTTQYYHKHWQTFSVKSAVNSIKKHDDFVLNRLDNLYDRIDELEEAISEVSNKISGVFGEQVCAEYLYKILLDFDIIYEKMSDYDKKAFFQNFIKSIEVYPDSKSKDRIVRHIDFRFPVANEEQFLLLTENDVETVVLMSRKDK